MILHKCTTCLDILIQNYTFIANFITYKSEFLCQTIFKLLCVCLSLSSERAVTSPSESAVIVTSAVECLRYCIVHNTEEEQGHKKIRTMLISQQVGSHSCTFLSHYVGCTSFPTLHCFVVCVFVASTTTRKGSRKSLPSEWSSFPFGH